MNPQTGENETEEFFPLFRPYVFYFLKEMSKYYEIIAFTAAQSTYANHRLYYKDLYRLNRDLVGTDSESDD